MQQQWTDPTDCIQFWSTDYQDDTAAKLALVKKMAAWCFRCSPPKEKLRWLLSNKLVISMVPQAVQNSLRKWFKICIVVVWHGCGSSFFPQCRLRTRYEWKWGTKQWVINVKEVNEFWINVLNSLVKIPNFLSWNYFELKDDFSEPSVNFGYLYLSVDHQEAL